MCLTFMLHSHLWGGCPLPQIVGKCRKVPVLLGGCSSRVQGVGKQICNLGILTEPFPQYWVKTEQRSFLLRTVSETAATKTPLHSFCAFLLNQVSLHQAPGSIKELHQGRPSEVSTFGMVFIRSLHLSGHWVNQQPSPCALTQSLALPDMCGLQSRMVMFFGNSYLRISGT